MINPNETTQDALEQRVMSIIATQLGREIGSLSPHATFKEAGVSSLEFIEILFALEEQLGVVFDANPQGIALDTLQDFVGEVRRQLAARADKPPSA